jgi:DNA-binding NarL/FixJ family response regulator
LAAENGEAALRAIHANNPDLLIAAVSMARLDGLELLRIVHEIAPRVRVILIAKGNRQVDRSYMKLAKLLGAAATFTQPLDETTFLSGVRTALDLGTSSD